MFNASLGAVECMGRDIQDTSKGPQPNGPDDLPDGRLRTCGFGMGAPRGVRRGSLGHAELRPTRNRSPKDAEVDQMESSDWSN